MQQQRAPHAHGFPTVAVYDNVGGGREEGLRERQQRSLHSSQASGAKKEAKSLASLSGGVLAGSSAGASQGEEGGEARQAGRP